GHIPEAKHQFLGTLMRNLQDLDSERPVVAQCQAGGRSAIASSILQRAGFDVINMQGGYQQWTKAGLPTAHEGAAAGR
ncbi:MAG TPA: rhodanese-like domain-containing protein, partial [Lacipirellulaceae bacterium]|nr:rhodanese-like domain-containing protein [Lacipirellulaceae bacterium]